MAKQQARDIHLVIRFSDALFGGVKTIEVHQEVIVEQGAVWLAKVGKPLGQQRIAKLNRQVETGVQTLLFLVQRKGHTYIWAKGHIAFVQRDLPESEMQLVPTYYHTSGLLQHASTWFKLVSLSGAAKESIGNLVVASSGKPIYEALTESMAAMFIVQWEG